MYEDNKLDDTVIDGVVYTIELSDRVMSAVQHGKMENFIIECALATISLDKLDDDSFMIVNRQLNVVIIGDKQETKITIDKVEWLSQFKIFGL